MRRAVANVDANQPAIVDALREVGASVLVLNREVDLIVGFRQQTVLMETKNPQGRNRLQASQKRLLAEWRGAPIAVVRTRWEALAAIGAVEATSPSREG